ncbi:AmmeMemoRadiSam system protein A [Seongchinamella unica]|uniref:AmmeMemoRadiSam system protein A n=1 Tax=Seongchinamella unica TaxID=2547392 RepID=A0A4R5LNK0_9GAMM|nr:AmmeMemoRadiSam system protein A [Seongchinamella unica]TDG11904.1 AmmeMemoRadiSam system protein A [Seongchinamella unica]
MAPSAFTELSEPAKHWLLATARRVISGRQPLADIPADPGLGQCRGVFVTLKKNGALRGCIGQLEADRPLSVMVTECAEGAAFRDPRFPALGEREVRLVRISISVLSPPQRMAVRDRADLLAQLQPGVDGLVIAAGHRQATFLPSVWEQLPQKVQFLEQLLAKAGLPPDYWSGEMACSRYRSCNFTEPSPRTDPRSPIRAGSR